METVFIPTYLFSEYTLNGKTKSSYSLYRLSSISTHYYKVKIKHKVSGAAAWTIVIPIISLILKNTRAMASTIKLLPWQFTMSNWL